MAIGRASKTLRQTSTNVARGVQTVEEALAAVKAEVGAKM